VRPLAQVAHFAIDRPKSALEHLPFKQARRTAQRAARFAHDAGGGTVPAMTIHGVNYPAHHQAGVGAELIAPFAQFVQHPGVGTGVGAAAAFPWGTRLRAPQKWDMAAGGGMVRRDAERAAEDAAHLRRYREHSPNADIHPTHDYYARDQHGQVLGRSSLEMRPNETYVHWVGRYGQENTPTSTLVDLLAPALNRFKTGGVPIDAQVVNGKLAQLALKLERRNPGMFTPHALAQIKQTLRDYRPSPDAANIQAAMQQARRMAAAAEAARRH